MSIVDAYLRGSLPQIPGNDRQWTNTELQKVELTIQRIVEVLDEFDRRLGGGSWQMPLILGANYLWLDASSRLRVKTSAPTSDTDGTIVGTQA